jgi:uncharacterized protein
MSVAPPVPGALGPSVRRTDSPAQLIAETGMILRVLVGSTVHGTALEGQDDRDEMGICVEPPSTVVGLDSFTHYEFRTQPTGARSGPGDLDLIVYGLRRYASLVARGNPTMLLPLFVPEDAICYCDVFGRELRAQRDMFVSKRVGARFLGYLNNQRNRLLGVSSDGTSNRHLRAMYGFDTKSAVHMVRLGMQGVALLEHGSITLPIPPGQLTPLRELRQGMRTQEWALDEARRYEARITELLSSAPVPDEPDYPRINEWLRGVHLRYWSALRRVMHRGDDEDDAAT